MSEQIPSKLRLFVALELPVEWRSRLAAVQRDLEGLGPGAMRWVRPEILHLTLLFLGDQSASAVPMLEAALGKTVGDFPPFELGLAGYGTFRRRASVAVVWAALDDPARQ